MAKKKMFKQKAQKIRSKIIDHSFIQSNDQSAFNSKKYSRSISNSVPSFENFSRESSIHGLRFLSKGQNNTFSRIFWSISLILSLIGLLHNAKRLYIKLNISPDIAVSVKYELAREVPFPAVTICMPLFAKNRLANLSQYMTEFNKNGRKNILDLSETEKIYLTSNSMKCAINRLQPINECCNKTEISNIIDVLDKSAPTIDEALAACSLKLVTTDCDKIFKRILTDRSFCYTANMQNIGTILKKQKLSIDLQQYYEYPQTQSTQNIYWTLDNGFVNDSVKNVIPYRLSKANVHIARTFSSPEDAENFCNFKNIIVRIHLPNEIPTTFHNGFQIEHGHEKRLKLRAKATKAHPSLRSYSPEARGCYFEGERELEYFKVYTKYHCYFECLTQNVIEKCGCAAFYMLRNSSVRICGLRDALCLHNSSYEWPDESDLETGPIPCDCYPTCNDIEYTASEIDFAYDAAVHADRIKNYSKRMVYSRIYVHFDDHVIQMNEKFVSYKFQNFIADLGGLLGLFLGCSLLSMIEVLYFVCIKLSDKYFKKNKYCDERHQSKNKVDAEKNHDEFLRTLDKIGNDVYVIRTPLYKRAHFK